MRPLVLAAVLGTLLLMGSACAASRAQGETGPTSPGDPTVSLAPVAVPGTDPYLRLARTLQDRGVEVWFEADLVKAWLAGPGAFATAVNRLGGLAAATDVAGFKVADELGYQDGITSMDEALAFLHAVRVALRTVAPHAQVLIDMVVPELGCLPWRGSAQQACAAPVRDRYPAATQAAVTAYLRAGLVDRLDLSTGLLDAGTYAGWGLTTLQAQQDAWAHAAADWARLTTLQARKALAAPGGYAGASADAAADLATYVDEPVAAGARAVDIWTWRQPYDGATVSLLAADLRPNPLWSGLVARHEAGTALFTHMTPSQMPANARDFAHECAVAGEAFSAVFVAAGTG